MKLKKKIHDIPLFRLMAGEPDARIHPPEKLERLARSIHLLGVFTPLLVEPVGYTEDGEVAFHILAGSARYLSAQKLNLDTLPCLIVTDLEDWERTSLCLLDNVVAWTGAWDGESIEDRLDALEGMKEAGIEAKNVIAECLRFRPDLSSVAPQRHEESHMFQTDMLEELEDPNHVQG